MMPERDSSTTGIALTDSQKIAWLRLIRSENVGPATFRSLIDHFGTARAALEALPDLSARGGAARRIRVASQSDAEKEFETAHRFGARFVGIGEPDYPPALREIEGAPPLLAMKGSGSTASATSIGIVGSRNASVAGAKFTAMLARDCASAGYVIASGLARGIDAAAHRASLTCGTIAALAGGLDRPYPPENFGLLDAIYDNGGVAISEMPFGWEPRARDFPRRNRLIAGVALGLVVIEAASRSGSLITARLAGDFGRIVFAVPGSPLDARCAGTNGLIREGAILTTCAADVLEALTPLREPGLPLRQNLEEPQARAAADMPPPDDDIRTRIVQSLNHTPVEIDDVIRHTGAATSTVYMVLLELELAGRLQRHTGGRVSLMATG